MNVPINACFQIAIANTSSRFFIRNTRHTRHTSPSKLQHRVVTLRCVTGAPFVCERGISLALSIAGEPHEHQHELCIVSHCERPRHSSARSPKSPVLGVDGPRRYPSRTMLFLRLHLHQPAPNFITQGAAGQTTLPLFRRYVRRAPLSFLLPSTQPPLNIGCRGTALTTTIPTILSSCV